jgi:uncharacterized protein (TIGR02646 family)
MAFFVRQENPPVYSSPGKYKEHLRRDFLRRCAYCERTEPHMGGEEAFEVEHLRPRSKFPDLVCTYSNLYYACRGCNGHKSETWPSEKQATKGLRFADPCVEDPYVHHLREREDGALEALTACGAYSNGHLRLDRKDVREWRSLRAQARRDLPRLESVARFLEQWPAREQVAEELSAVRRRIAESKIRFSIE